MRVRNSVHPDAFQFICLDERETALRRINNPLRVGKHTPPYRAAGTVTETHNILLVPLSLMRTHICPVFACAVWGGLKASPGDASTALANLSTQRCFNHGWRAHTSNWLTLRCPRGEFFLITASAI